MPETDTIPVSASIASTGPGIRYIGQHCYAYNLVDVANVELSLLEVTTGSGYIVATLQFGYTEATTDNFRYRIYLNDILTQAYITTAADNYTSPDNLLPILIPPFTKLKATAANISSSDDIIQAVSLVGRVYGAD